MLVACSGEGQQIRPLIHHGERVRFRPAVCPAAGFYQGHPLYRAMAWGVEGRCL